MSEKIEIGYRNIGNELNIDYYHKFLLYTNKNGEQYTISGWTDDNNQTDALPFGNIRILANQPYDNKNPDSFERHPNQKQYRELITEAPDLSAKWAEMVRNARSKDNIYPYDPIRQNSNTLADTVLREAGLPEPKKDFTVHLSPGSGNKLDKNLVPKSQEDLGISDLRHVISTDENKTREMYQKTREIIDKDPNKMSQNGYEGQPQYAQTRSLGIEDVPAPAQKLYAQTEERMRAFYQEFDVPFQEHELKNAAAALAVVAYEKRLPEVQDFELHNGRMVAFYESRGGAYKEALLDAGFANTMPQQQSFARMIEAEPKLELAAQQRAMEIAAYEQSQSRGMSI